MKNRFAITLQFVRPFVLVSLLCVLCGQSSGQDFKTLHSGVEYARVDHKIGSDPVKINLLRLDLARTRLDVHHAFDKAIGLETTSSIAKRKNAVAAINAGFFRLDRSEFAGDAAGVLMIDGELMSESTNTRIGISIQNLKRYSVVFFNRIAASLQLQIGKPGAIKTFDVSGINRSLGKNEVVVYSPSFGPATMTRETSYEVRLTKCSAGRMIGSFRDDVCRKIEPVRNSSNMTIPADGFVVAVGSEYVSRSQDDLSAEIAKLVQKAKSAGVVRIRKPILLDGGQFSTDRNVDMTNGVPQLIKAGKIDITWEQEKASKSFAEMRHPRTAVAKLKDGRFLMMTVDGRQPGVSVGMNLRELAEYLLSLGAVDAMNLDGGGSTTMYVDGKVVNTPSDKEGERKVGDAIVVTLRKNARR
jgi:exopolysaccharide biosynthesis protein